MTPARVARAWDETPAQRGLVLVVDRDWRARHVAPGQFLRARAAGIDADDHFALANAPGEDPELLVKRGSPLSDALAALPVGAELRVTRPEGAGFPIDDHLGRDVVLMGAGTGIAPLRAVLHHMLPRRERWGRVRLYYGQRNPEEFAYARERADWAERGVEIILVLSDTDPGWGGARGWVQHALAADPPPLADAVVYLCGMAEMVIDAGRALAALGVPSERIFLNY